MTFLLEQPKKNIKQEIFIFLQVLRYLKELIRVFFLIDFIIRLKKELIKKEYSYIKKENKENLLYF